MSRFFSEKFAALTPYTPGEQPQDQAYIKLNTNESPFPPSPKAVAAACAAAENLQLYPDPTVARLRAALGETLGVPAACVTVGNGSDEVLNFAFMAFCDETHPAAFADITYGFYPVFAVQNGIPFTEIPLRAGLSLAPEDYFDLGKTIFIANPNAPTGMALPRDAIEQIVRRNRDSVVVVDEAYVDFGGESAVPLTQKYENLLVVGTFSKSRSMAGARLGFGAGDPALIRDIETLRYSTNPYNVNSMTMAAGLGALADEPYTRKNCQTVCENREFTAKELAARGFTVLPSKTNFLFAAHPKIDGRALYLALKARGVLVRHFDLARIAAYNRITIGTREQMNEFLKRLDAVTEEML